MASRTLAVKYRPKTWESVTEQSSIKIILQQQLESGEIKNAYLFTGPAGCGKTTSARIFAHDINKGQGNPIEMDAASNSGVDDVRNIIQQAQTKSLDSEYKVFIIDECFPGNTLVKTATSEKRISDIVPGDIVKSMSGNKIVTHIFKNRVLTDRLCCVTMNNRKITTTVEHLFFTNHGWIMASQLQRGDIVYGSEDLQELWERVCKETGQRREVLLKQLCDQVSLSKHDRGTKTESAKRTKSVSYMPTKVCSEGDFITKDLFSRVQESTYYEVEQTVDEYKIWDGTSETVIRKNVGEKSYEGFPEHTKNAEYKGEEWNTSSVSYSSGWERKVYNSTDRLVAGIRVWLGIGIPNKYEKSELARDEVTLVLQSRPWLFREKTGDRGRWSRPQVEKFIIEGCEKNRSSRNVGVESVEIYKRGYNDELFRGSFTDSELSSGYVTMYDLEVDGDHSYFVENCLVHNCHSISNTGWQAFLKLIEEPPAKSIFIFCTTDPQKIPKTILSRVQRYDFTKISQDGIVGRLHYILYQEDIYDDSNAINDTLPALEYIAKIADGGMREAISLMDKALAYSTDLTLENVVKALGTTDYETMFSLADAICGNKDEDVITIIEQLYNDGKDIKRFVKQFTQFLLDVQKYDIMGDKAWSYMNIPKLADYESELNSWGDYEYSTMFDLLDVFEKLNSDIKYSSVPKYDVEIAILLFMRKSNVD